MEVNSRVNDGRWGDCNSDEVDKGSHSEDGREHGSFQPQAQALMVAKRVDNNDVLDVEHVDTDGGNKDASLIIEVNLLKVVGILGISVEGHIGELRRFVSKMVEEDKRKQKGGNQSKKKTKAQRELDKLAFFVNYDSQISDNEDGVKLLGL